VSHALSISVVLYHANLDLLRQTVGSLRVALDRSRAAGLAGPAVFWLVDNGTDDPAVVDRVVESALGPQAEWLQLEVLRGHGNIGYGRGHDLAIARAKGGCHLVLNPDVVLAPDAIVEALSYLDAHQEVGMVTPHVRGPTGDREFLCKRYPSLLVLALRGFGPGWLQRRFRRLLDRYEMRDLPEDEPAIGIPIASGCFMLARGEALQAIGGFSPRYFLYFEDFDLSLRFRRVAEIAYVPAVRIIHSGGNAARKGPLHQRFFIRSAFTFFSTHGWRLW
jgi:GT2 family glycosyltransferase